MSTFPSSYKLLISPALIDSSYITTFDSFSLSLVKKYHYLLNVKKNVNIIENNVLNIKTQEYLDEVMEEKRMIVY